MAKSDIVVSSKRRINLFDRVIQSVVIMVNMNKMNRAIDEHLATIRKIENDDDRLYQENVLREIVFVKYQYDIMQRQMYELKISYPDEIVDRINSQDKIERLELQKIFLEMEYDRITKAKFKLRDEVKFNLLSISSCVDEVKQNIKDEGKSQRYNRLIKAAEEVDNKIQTDEYTEKDYLELFERVDEYVSYINDNYDISKLPTDERELIEFVIETMIKGIESDIDKHMYEYNLTISICKNAYRYFKIVDRIFEKLQRIYDESLEKDVISVEDYLKMYKEIYDMKIKAMVNDVHRTMTTEDEYLEYSKLVTTFANEKLEEFLAVHAIDTTKSSIIEEKLNDFLKEDEENVEEVVIDEVEINDSNISDEEKEGSDELEILEEIEKEEKEKKVKKEKKNSKLKEPKTKVKTNTKKKKETV